MAYSFSGNARSMPRSGLPKSYEEAVKDFNVEKFAAMVHATGADYTGLIVCCNMKPVLL